MPLLYICYPILVHIAVLKQNIWLELSALILLIFISMSALLLQKNLKAWLIFAALIGLAIPLCTYGNGLFFLYFMPVAMYSLFLAIFGRTLLPGKTALITNIAAQIRGDMPAELARYTRRLTLLWCFIFIAMIACTVYLSIKGPVEYWSLFTNFISYGVITLAFVLEYIWRSLRYRHHWHPSLKEYIRGMFKVDFRQL